MAATLTVPGKAVAVTVATADEWVRVTLPPGTRKVSIRPLTNTGYYNSVGVDGAAITADKATLTNDIWYEENLDRKSHGNPPEISVSADTNGTVLEVIPEIR